MTYSIQQNKQKLFKYGEPVSTYVEWQPSFPLGSLFKEYESLYLVKNDVKIYNTSYFSILTSLFSGYNFSLEKFQQRLSDINSILYNKVYSFQYALYNKDDSYLDYSDEYYEEIASKAKNDANNLEPYLLEIAQKNYVIMEEFKSFIGGFFEYVKSKDPKEHGSFLGAYHVLFDDMQFFKKTKVQSLDKYAFTIGSHTKKHYESRGRDSNFIPAGYCSYGSQIFINSEPTNNKKYGKRWADRSIKHTFYHEMAHALDRLYYDDVVLKNGIKKTNSSYNPELMKCCKLSYKNLKRYSPQLKKKTITWLSYFCAPAIKKIHNHITEKPLSNNAQDILLNQIWTDMDILFGKFTAENKLSNTFSTKFKKDNIEYNYARALEETWSESFAFIFNWIKNPFCEYDRYTLKAGKSQERTYIKINYKALMYILDNFDWSKLNIPYSVFLRKRVQIKKLLNYVNEMPLVLNHTRIREFKNKKYLKFNDILKSK